MGIRQFLMILSAFWFGAVPAAGDWLLGLSYYQQGKYRRAVKELLTAVRENPEDALANRILGLSYYHLQDYGQAETFLRSATELQPDIQAELGLARIHARRRHYKTALQALEESQALIKTDRHRFQFHFARGSILLSQGHPAQAHPEFKKAEPFGRDQPTFYAQLGSLEYNLGDVAAAVAALERSLELNRRQPAVLVSLGEVCLRLSSTQRSEGTGSYLERAVDLAGEALALSPESAEAHNLAGRAYLGLRDFPNAERHFRRVLAFDGGHPGIFYSLGQVLIGLNRYLEGAEALERAVAVSPQDATIHYALGFCREKAGHDRKALESYRRAHQLRPGPESTAAVERVQRRLDPAK